VRQTLLADWPDPHPVAVTEMCVLLGGLWGKLLLFGPEEADLRSLSLPPFSVPRTRTVPLRDSRGRSPYKRPLREPPESPRDALVPTRLSCHTNSSSISQEDLLSDMNEGLLV